LIVPQTAARKKPSKIYSPPSFAAHQNENDPLTYWVQCPKCKGRAMDISDLPERLITLRSKCPICHNIVDMPIVAPVVHKQLTLFDL